MIRPVFLHTIVTFFILSVLMSCSLSDVNMDTSILRVKLNNFDVKTDSCMVSLRDQHNNVFYSVVGVDGVASFSVPAGIYSASLSYTISDSYFRVVYNAFNSGVVVGNDMPEYVSLDVKATKIQMANPLLIKEVYNGGCQKDDGSGKFFYDKSLILYNNSSQEVSLRNVAIGIVDPYNAESSSHLFLNGNTLLYESEDWIPSINGIWYFDPSATLDAYSELVVNVCGAVNNTLSYSNSVNYANPNYYCMYDPQASSSDGSMYNNTTYYPAPSEVIPTSHYLHAVKYGKGNAWPLSNSSPAIVLFSSGDIDISSFASDINNIVYPASKQGDPVYACLRLPRAWVFDGIEIFNANSLSQCRKRLTSDIDNGYVSLTSGFGHSLVRYIDKNASAMVNNIIYVDTNNSTNDFYEADKCSIK